MLRGGVEAAGRELREAAKELQLLRRSQGDQQRQEQQLEAVLEGMASREDRIRDAVDLRLQETAAALRGLQVRQPICPVPLFSSSSSCCC